MTWTSAWGRCVALPVPHRRSADGSREAPAPRRPVGGLSFFQGWGGVVRWDCRERDRVAARPTSARALSVVAWSCRSGWGGRTRTRGSRGTRARADRGAVRTRIGPPPPAHGVTTLDVVLLGV